jgi:hypothetical protein
VEDSVRFVENRLEGDAGYLNFVIPLSGGAH